MLQNLPAGLFDQLLNRRQGQDVEATAATEEQQSLLRKVFLEACEHTRTHEQDMEIVRDLEIQAIKKEIARKRAAADLAALLPLEKKLRELEWRAFSSTAFKILANEFQSNSPLGPLWLNSQERHDPGAQNPTLFKSEKMNWRP